MSFDYNLYARKDIEKTDLTLAKAKLKRQLAAKHDGELALDGELISKGTKELSESINNISKRLEILNKELKELRHNASSIDEDALEVITKQLKRETEEAQQQAERDHTNAIGIVCLIWLVGFLWIGSSEKGTWGGILLWTAMMGFFLYLIAKD